MKKPVLVIMAAGMGSRYGGLKKNETHHFPGAIIIIFFFYFYFCARSVKVGIFF